MFRDLLDVEIYELGIHKSSPGKFDSAITPFSAYMKCFTSRDANSVFILKCSR